MYSTKLEAVVLVPNLRYRLVINPWLLISDIFCYNYLREQSKQITKLKVPAIQFY